MKAYLFLILGLVLTPALEQAQSVEDRYKAIKAALQSPCFKESAKQPEKAFYPVLINEETCCFRYDPDHIFYHDIKLIEQEEDQFIDIAQVKLKEDSARVVFNFRANKITATVDLEKRDKEWLIVSDYCAKSNFTITKESLLFQAIQRAKSFEERIKSLEK